MPSCTSHPSQDFFTEDYIPSYLDTIPSPYHPTSYSSLHPILVAIISKLNNHYSIISIPNKMLYPELPINGTPYPTIFFRLDPAPIFDVKFQNI